MPATTRADAERSLSSSAANTFAAAGWMMSESSSATAHLLSVVNLGAGRMLGAVKGNAGTQSPPLATARADAALVSRENS
jgi:hypothetical protein